jgi:hypothetical protein
MGSVPESVLHVFAADAWTDAAQDAEVIKIENNDFDVRVNILSQERCISGITINNKNYLTNSYTNQYRIGLSKDAGVIILEKMIDEIEMKLLNWNSVEIPSREIGKMIMEKLKGIDPMAYVRFASVYLDLDSIDEFKKLLEQTNVGFRLDSNQAVP